MSTDYNALHKQVRDALSEIRWPSYHSRMKLLSKVLFLELGTRAGNNAVIKAKIEASEVNVLELIQEIRAHTRRERLELASRGSRTSGIAVGDAVPQPAAPTKPLPPSPPFTKHPAHSNPSLSHPVGRSIIAAPFSKEKRSRGADDRGYRAVSASQFESSATTGFSERTSSSNEAGEIVVPTRTVKMNHNGYTNVFVFCGEGRKKSGETRKKQRKLFYDAVIFKKIYTESPEPGHQSPRRGGETTVFRIGDAYMLSTGNPNEKPFLAFCTELYYDETAREANMVGQWFYRYEDLVDTEQRRVPHRNSADDSEMVFLSAETEVNPLESVLQRVQVSFTTDDKMIRQAKLALIAKELVPHFTCNYFYHRTKLLCLSEDKFKAIPAVPVPEEEITHWLNSDYAFSKPLPCHLIPRRHKVAGMAATRSKRRATNAAMDRPTKARRMVSNEFDAVPFIDESDDQFLKKEDSVRVKTKHAGIYCYRIRGGSSFLKDGKLTQVALKREKKRRGGKWLGFIEAGAVLTDLRGHEINSPSKKGAPIFFPSKTLFEEPVKKSDFPDYQDIVKQPMCLARIESKLEQYVSYAEFAADVRLIVSNCYLYNPPDTSYEILAMADSFLDYFESVTRLIRPRLDEREVSLAASSSATALVHYDSVRRGHAVPVEYKIEEAVEL